MYLTISESIAGNIKDLVIYLVIRKMIANTVIHLHGGSFGKQILDRLPLLRKLNKYFLSKVGAVVVSGPSHIGIFAKIIPRSKIHVVPNFAQESLFVCPEIVERKFHNDQKSVNVLYLSGMTDRKGYLRLLDAYESLNRDLKSRINLDFAGMFDCQSEERRFNERIRSLSGITYHGIVSDKIKADLFARAHVFCLPTSFKEGQPISILEAYAAGCVVLSTPQPGILDIFEPMINGFIISSEGINLLREVLETHCQNIESLRRIAIHNRQVAEEKYRERIFCGRLESILIDKIY
jgi:glycosyltransferase involved in cell wall biosynthesis